MCYILADNQRKFCAVDDGIKQILHYKLRFRLLQDALCCRTPFPPPLPFVFVPHACTLQILSFHQTVLGGDVAVQIFFLTVTSLAKFTHIFFLLSRSLSSSSLSSTILPSKAFIQIPDLSHSYERTLPDGAWQCAAIFSWPLTCLKPWPSAMVHTARCAYSKISVRFRCI